MAVNVAVIGVGDFGVKHVKLLKENINANLLTVCRRNREKAREIANEFDVPKWSTDALEVLRDPGIDAVVIATAEDTHYKFTKEAVLNGKHVLLEKPVCLDPDVGQQLVDLVKTNDRIVLPGHILRYDASYSEVKNLIESGEVGEILSIKVKRNVPQERFSLHSRTHPVFMALAHDIDIIVWLTCGQFPKKVYAVEKKSHHSYDNPDIFFGLMEMGNGVLCQMETQWTLPDEYGCYLDVELEVMTTGGHIKLQYPGNNLTVMNKSRLSRFDVTLWPEVHGATRGALANQTDSFLKLAEGLEKKRQVVTVEEAVKGIKIGHLLIQSASEQREIRVDF